jgi:hypothetical protein
MLARRKPINSKWENLNTKAHHFFFFALKIPGQEFLYEKRMKNFLSRPTSGQEEEEDKTK